ncbi:hypothetical protein GGR54DRAFT_629674 [Hypoxylon sp. NC1633]|nr:hypothetical protein GGR54DRAFT_629674 [Hypoxylon sp. NC1633]
MATTSPSWLDQAFKSAREDFKKSLKNPALFDFSKIASIEDVLDEATKIQKQQAKTKTLRGMKRLEPFINGLKEYAAVIEVFVQAKPDVMSFIWGPLKFILQASSSVISAFDKMVKVTADLGMTLPSFKAYTELFQSNDHIRRALCLFYADILDFYAVLLNFLTDRRLNIFLESLWPNIRSSIAKIQENMEHHKALMTTNVTLEDILQAHQARKRALDEYEYAQEFRDRQIFSAIRSELNPQGYDLDLVDILRRSSVSSGKWLRNKPDFTRWLDATDRTARCMWLYGIPGSGKTFLAGNLIKMMQSSGQRVLFVFLSHDNQQAGDTTKVFHSFLFQALEDDSTLRSILFEASQSDSRKLKNDSDFVMSLLCKVLQGLGPTYVVLDGLDELDETSWRHLLSSVLQINENCPETKLLISSREERDISLQLKSKAIPLRVDHNNFEDISSLVQLECDDMLLEMRSYGADERTCLQIKEKFGTIAEKAAGKLVVLMVKDQGTLRDIEAQMNDLPDGLDEVYGRLLGRIKNRPARRDLARAMLQWVACAQRPLREEEMLQMLAIEPGSPEFTKGRKVFRNVCKECGPIIEINEGTIRFVYFSAKEYLLHEQSDRFLSLSEAHFDAALVCTTYLSFSSLNPLFSSSADGVLDIREQTLGGDYVLFEYASMAFLEHLKSLETRDPDSRLLAVLHRFQEARTHGSVAVSAVPARFTRLFQMFANAPELQAFLSAVAYTQTQAQLGLLDHAETSKSSAIDPLNLFSARRTFRRNLESMVCEEPHHRPSCRCESLKRLYGTRIYHCDQHFCYAYQNGFQSMVDRSRHLEIHRRPHKCSVANCLFADVGFRDATELQRHTSAAHASQIFSGNASDSTVSLIQPSADMHQILEDAVRLGDTESIKQIILREGFAKPYLRARYIMQLASWNSSPEVLSLFLNEFKHKSDMESLDTLLAYALEGENLPNIKLLLSQGANMAASEIIISGLPDAKRPRSEFKQNGYVRALSLWNPDLMALLVNECHVDFPTELKKAGQIFANAAILGASIDDARRRFNGIKQYIIWPETYANGVASAANLGTVDSVRICLENGGDPNSIEHPNSIEKRTRKEGRSALHFAVKRGSRTGAEIVKVLLQYGADPEGKGSEKMKNLVGMKKIEKLFGCGWDEVVRRTRAGEDLVIGKIADQTG